MFRICHRFCYDTDYHCLCQQTQKKEKKVKERDSGVKAITTALKALPPDQQVSTLLAKYAEMAEENKRLQVHVVKLWHW